MSTTYQRTFNRYEYKYIVPQRLAERFIRDQDPYVYPDPHCDGEWGYPVHSVYWDSADLALFWEKIEGLMLRRKLRLRRYGDATDEVFVEIKQRVDRTVQKRRTRWSVGEALHVFGGNGNGGGSGGGADDPGDAVAAEALEMYYRHRLKPRMCVSYVRRAFFSRFEPGLRITFDRRLRYDPFCLDVSKPVSGGRDLLDPRLTIMEVKFNDRVPLWLSRAMQSHGFQMTRLSKYCTAVDRTWFGNRLT
ncbi:MAG TPA: polyphosphate polymerase domain-containing protein [Longimicrobiales bacterium]